MIDRRRFLAGCGTLALTAVAFTGLSAFGFADPASAQTVDTAKLMTPGPLPDQVLGKDDAPVTIVEYASLTCGHCAAFHETTYPVLKEKYIDTGKVRFILREFPLDIVAKAAFMLARCAGDGKYYPMTDVLFETQKNWAYANNPAQALMAIAKQGGMSEQQFNACLNDTTLAGQIDQAAQRAAQEFEVNSTPTFFINGKKVVGGMSVEVLDQELAPLLGAN